MYISKVVSNYIFFRYLRLFEVFDRSGKCPLWNASTQANICRAFVWSGKCPSGMCLFGEVSVGDVSDRRTIRWGCVWSGKCPSGDVSGRVNVCRGSALRGRVHRETSVGDVSGNPLNSMTYIVKCS